MSVVPWGLTCTLTSQLSETGKIVTSPLGSTQEDRILNIHFKLFRGKLATGGSVPSNVLWVEILRRECFLFPTSFAIASFALTRGSEISWEVSGFLTKEKTSWLCYGIIMSMEREFIVSYLDILVTSTNNYVINKW